MTMKCVTRFVIASMSVFALTTFFTVSAPIPEAHAKKCKSNVVSRLIKARYKSLGRQRARANWRRKARKRYGWRYRKWNKAKHRGYHVTIDGSKYLLYRIRAYGTPCK